GTARLVERDRPAEALWGARLRTEVRALEADVDTVAQRLGEREDVGERHPGPGGGPGRARTPGRLSRDVADRHQARAPIAGALQRRGHVALPARLPQRRE